MALAGGGGPLAQAVVAFGEIRTEVDNVTAKNEEPQDGALVPPEDLKKSVKWLQQSITKFGATAAVSDGPTDAAVIGISKEVVRSCIAVVNTLLCLATRGACSSLLSEIREMGSRLETTITELGQAVGTPQMAGYAGKTLESLKHLERISTNNRASIRRRLLKSLAQLRDAQRELNEELLRAAGDQDDAANAEAIDSDEDDLDVDCQMEPEERRLVESMVVLIEAVNAVAEQASRSCMPSSPSPSGGSSGGGGTSTAILEMEAVALQVEMSSQAIDGLAASGVGGLDAEEFKASLAKMRSAISGFGTYPEQFAAAERALDGVQAALEAMPPS